MPPKLQPVRLGPVLLRPMAVSGSRARWRAEWYPPGSHGKMSTRTLSKARGERITADEAVARAVDLMADGDHLVSVDESATPTTKVVTVLDLMEVWLGVQQHRVGVEIRPSTFRVYKFRCKVVARDAFADTTLDKVTPRQVQAFYRRLREVYEDRTIQMVFKVMTAAWNWGLKQPEPIVGGPFPVLHWKRDPRPQHCPTDAQVEATLAELSRMQGDGGRKQYKSVPDRLGQTIVALEVLWGTGARPQELANSPVSAFDLASGIWTVPGGLGSKTGRRRVPLSPGIRQVLTDFLDGREDDLLFPPKVHELGTRWNRYAKTAAARVGVPRWTCKGLRHLAITNMLVAGVEVQTVAAVVGNSPATIWKTYAHVLHGRPERSVVHIGRARQSPSSTQEKDR